MTAQDPIQTAVKAIDDMTVEELEAWVAAGDYTSLGGVSLPDDVTERLTEALAEPEVSGFAVDLGLGLKLNSAVPDPGGSLGGTPLGGHSERKAGGKQQEFLKFTLTEILIG
jgi:hypothetical protein